MTISHADDTGADAFNVQLSDLVPAGVTFLPGSLAYVPSGLPGGLAPTSLNHDAAGDLILVSYDSFTHARFSVFTFKAVVDSNIQAFQRVTNTARIEYTSLPGRPQASSPYNANSVERTGAPADPGGSANNLNANASASFTPTPTITKVLVDTNQTFTTGNAVAIGETARYRVTIQISEGVSPAAIFSDPLPDGLALVSLDQLIVSPALTTSLGNFANVLQNARVEKPGASVHTRPR